MKDNAQILKFKLSLLGRFELTAPDGVVHLPSKKLAGLLAYLACRSRPQPRERLADLLWGSHFEAQARQNLRQTLSLLRRILGHEALVSEDNEVSLAPGIIDCDVIRFEALVAEESRASLAAAADLYRNPLLTDLNIAEEAWLDWRNSERERLAELAVDAMVKHGQQALRAGNTAAALKNANRAIAVNALREDAHRLTIQTLAALGRKAEAFKYYQDLAARLRRELSTEPDAATRLLVAELRSAPPPGTSRTSIEFHREIRRTSGWKTDTEITAARADDAAAEVVVRSNSFEQRQLTIMACNLIGPMPFSGSLDPEDVHDRIASFHKMVTDITEQFDGFVAQYQGYGALIYFGYPAAHERDAERAVRTGLAILTSARRLNTSSDMQIQASIGIATGLVVVGKDDSRQHVATGETLNLATQLQSRAAAGELIIAASTKRIVGRMFDCCKLPTGDGKQLPQSVKAWQVRGETAGVSRFDARRGDILYPFVGRQEEIELLLRRWDQAKVSGGRVVILAGEAGIGKSRIVENILATLGGEPHMRFRYFCSPYHTHSPLSPFIAQIEQDAGFAPGDSVSARLDKLETLLRPTATHLPRDVTLFAELVGVPMDGRYPALTASPQQKREMTLGALLNRLNDTASRTPVLIVVEDAHWIDPTSLDLLEQMVSSATQWPMLLLVTFRPEFQPSWVGQSHVTTLSLSRLGPNDSAGIIRGIARDKPLPDDVVGQIVSRTDGVPLFIEELTRTLLESGLLRETADSYVLDGPLPSRAIPTTLQASLLARLDMLGSARDVAMIGAAIGREFSHKLIAAVSPLNPMDLNAALARLIASGLISRRGTPPETNYVFKHALVQDAAYITMLRSRRRKLHASIAKTLVARFPALIESQPEIVAHHFTEAGLAGEAIGYWVKAGRYACARWANREAARFFEQALRGLETLPETRETLQQAFDASLELRSILAQLAEPNRALACLQKAETIAERLNDEHRRGWVCALLTNAHSHLAKLDEALASGIRARELGARLSDLRLRILATTYLEQLHFYRGEHQEVVALATENLSALPANWTSEFFGIAAPPSVYDRGWLMMSLAELGRFAEAEQHAPETIRLAKATGHAHTIGWADATTATIHMLKGEWVEARPLLDHAIAISDEGGVSVLYPSLVACSAWTLAQLGEAKEALRRLEEGELLLGHHVASGFVGLLGWLFLRLGRAALVLGRLHDAQRLGHCALESSRHQPGFAVHAQHLLGDVAAHSEGSSNAEDSEAYYHNALALAQELNMRPLVAHCHHSLGKLYRRTGKPDQARDKFTVATTMYREMNMQFWLKQAETTSAAVITALHEPGLDKTTDGLTPIN